MHVLLIGDPPSFATLAVDADFLVEHVATTEVSIQHLAAERYDLIFVSGSARSNTPARKQLIDTAMVPIIALCNSEEEVLEALGSGCHEAFVANTGQTSSLGQAVSRAKARLLHLRAQEQRWDTIAALSRMRLVDRLANGVAHEINNPLAIVTGNLTTFAEYIDEIAEFFQKHPQGAQELDEVLQDSPSLVEESLTASHRIRDKVLLLQRFSCQTLENQPHVEINSLLEATLGFLQGVLGAQVDIALDLQPLPELVGDATAVGYVFFTIFENAVKTDSRQTRVALTLNTRCEQGIIIVSIVVSNADSTPKNQLEIFAPLAGKPAAGSDSGLELAACRRIIEQLQGHITVEAVENLFSLNIRFATTPATQSAPPIKESTDKHSLLFIDDEATLLRSYRRGFRKGYRVSLASTGTEALQLLAKDQTFDAIICDLKMPDTDGVSFFEAVEQSYPALVKKIIFVAGELSSPRHLRFRESLQNIFLQKPVPIKQLRDVIHQVCGE